MNNKEKNDKDKTQSQVVQELQQLRQRVNELEAATLNYNQAGKTLQESERRYKALVEASFEGIVVTEKGTIVDANDQLGELFGYARKEMAGKSFLDMVAPESRELVAEAIRKHTPEPYELVALHKNGTSFPVEVRDRDTTIGGRRLRFTALRDISESKRIREALEQERNLMRTLIDNLPDLIFVKDVSGRYLLNNRAHMHSMGVKRQEDILGKTTFDFNPHELAMLYTKDEGEIVRSGKALIEREEIALHRDKLEERWHLTTKVPIVNALGKITGVVGIARDITERKRAEEALLHERILLRTVIDNIPDAVYVKDKAGRRTVTNPADIKQMGRKDEREVLGKDDSALYPKERAAANAADDQLVLQSGLPLVDKEESFIDDGNRRHWLVTSKLPLRDEKSNVIGLVGIGRDVTPWKEADSTLRDERNLLRTLIDNLPVLIFFKDKNGRYLLNNRPHLRSLGAERQEDVLGKTTFDFNPHELATLYSKDEREVLRTGVAMYNVEEKALHRDSDEVRWHLTSKVPLIDNEGGVTGMVGIAADITDRKKAEAEREKLIAELQRALADVRTLSGLVPICANCKKIRDDGGYWRQLEAYIQERTPAHFSHGICPDCMSKLYPDYHPKDREEGSRGSSGNNAGSGPEKN